MIKNHIFLKTIEPDKTVFLEVNLIKKMRHKCLAYTETLEPMCSVYIQFHEYLKLERTEKAKLNNLHFINKEWQENTRARSLS